ncbi:MAG TPA: RcnB family protein [Sphingomicrobium sp.]|nr:RcnB family protein [Sphingomicrobium sp.]
MKKFILLAAVAAIAVPGAAQAQQHEQARHDRQLARQDQRSTVRANREVMRSDRRAVRADRRVASAERDVGRAERNVARADRHEHMTYVAPMRHWTHRPVSVGYRLQAPFYGSRYYITDYSMYDLQAPHSRWLRWIRYGNDLVLVNVRTGRVMDVVHHNGW